MYTLWRDLLPKLLMAESSSFLKEKADQYHSQLVQKSKESVSSFKGSWEKDMYGEEGSLRDRLAEQLRSQDH